MSDSPKLDPVIISILQKLTVSKMVDDILGVQPMTSPFCKEEWPYQVDILQFVKFEKVIEVKSWCTNNLLEGEWISKVQFFAFKTEKTYVTFMLVWE